MTASGDRILAAVFSCNFLASHEFFIHRERLRQKKKDFMVSLC